MIIYTLRDQALAALARPQCSDFHSHFSHSERLRAQIPHLLDRKLRQVMQGVRAASAPRNARSEERLLITFRGLGDLRARGRRRLFDLR